MISRIAEYKGNAAHRRCIKVVPCATTTFNVGRSCSSSAVSRSSSFNNGLFATCRVSVGIWNSSFSTMRTGNTRIALLADHRVIRKSDFRLDEDAAVQVGCRIYGLVTNPLVYLASQARFYARCSRLFSRLSFFYAIFSFPRH